MKNDKKKTSAFIAIKLLILCCYYIYITYILAKPIYLLYHIVILNSESKIQYVYNYICNIIRNTIYNAIHNKIFFNIICFYFNNVIFINKRFINIFL